MQKVRVGIIGATGYAGAEIVRLLLLHPMTEIVWYGSETYVDQKFASVYRSFFQIVDGVCGEKRLEELADRVDVIFTATPQGFLSSHLTEELIEKVKIIDLSADFRIRDARVYEEWYQIRHQTPALIERAVYGLCELNRDRIRETRLVANPGCYTTCSILAAYPLVREGYIDGNSLIIDAKSGASGAGRGCKTESLFCEVNENIRPYGVTTHRHTPEIEEQLGCAGGQPITISFTPHLVPMNRGILVTAYADLREVRLEDGSLALPGEAMIRAAYEKYYGGERFVRVLEPGRLPETRWVKGSNYVDINFVLDPRKGRVILMAALDNLVKGAAGQAVQNMNLICGLEEGLGLDMPPAFP